MSFHYVELCTEYGAEAPKEDDFWLAQRAAVTKLPAVGFATTTDIERALHPPDKQDVAARLLLSVQRLAYGLPVVSRGPEVVSTTSGCEGTFEVPPAVATEPVDALGGCGPSPAADCLKDWLCCTNGDIVGYPRHICCPPNTACAAKWKSAGDACVRKHPGAVKAKVEAPNSGLSASQIASLWKGTGGTTTTTTTTPASASTATAAGGRSAASSTLTITFSNSSLAVHGGIYVGGGSSSVAAAACPTGGNSAFSQVGQGGKVVVPLNFTISGAKVAVTCDPASGSVLLNSDRQASCFLYSTESGLPAPPVEIPCK